MLTVNILHLKSIVGGFLKLNNSIAHRVENKGERGREEGENCGGPKRGPQIEQTHHLRSREPRSAPKTP